jgi:alginate O-acetyltransferase complex protein AlgI
VFLPVLLALYTLPWERYRNWLLLAASVVFYANGAGSFTVLVALSIVFNYVAALVVARSRDTSAGPWILRGVVTVNLLVLGIFKYANFFGDNLNALLVAVRLTPIAVPKVLLPIGISFFTFHAISYVVDVYRQDASAQKRPVDAALYLLLFPQLIAGPIIRYRQIADQLARRVTTLGDFAAGVRRFITGFAKKMLVANTLAVPADQIFAMPLTHLTAAHAWTGIVCYTLQIYFDFSGYSDMAIGLGRMFGFRFPENFRYPYAATSIQEFWRRWHMSLSAWFRDYVYVPLGGNRVSNRRLYVNLITVFFLCGLWHGASWTFVVWGLFHGAFLVAERVGLGPRVAALPRVARHVYALLVVMVGWVLFRADTLGGAWGFLQAMAGLNSASPTPYTAAWYLTPHVLITLAAAVIGSGPVLHEAARWRERSLQRRPRLAPVWDSALTAALMLLLVGGVMQTAAGTYNPFIYFRF